MEDVGRPVATTLDLDKQRRVWLDTMQAVVPPMIAAGTGGSIITVSSAAGIKLFQG